MKYTLRDYQKKGVEDLRGMFRQGYRAPLYALPTGGGKSLVFCHIAEQAAAKGNRIMIVVHRRELLDQASNILSDIGIKHGIIAPSRCMTGDLVQVASVDTLIRRLNIVPRPDLMIIDEAHHSIQGNKWGNVAKFFKSYLLGVTATPTRTNGAGLGAQYQGYFDCLVNGPSIRELIDRGWLSQPVIYAPPVGMDLTGVHTRGGDYAQEELEDRLDKSKITGCAVDHYKRICPGMPAIAFCVSIKHAAHVAEQFNAAGIPAASIDGTMQMSVRDSRIKDLGGGRLKVLTSCEIVSEGTDIPVVTTAILLRPTQSLGMHLQQAGRVLRIHPGKKCSYILDHVNNTSRHGLVDEVRKWSLKPSEDVGKKKKPEDIARSRQCKQCYAVYPLGREFCPQCGAMWQPEAREIKQVSGELKPLSPEEAAILKARAEAKREQGKSQSLEQLKELARRRGYKPGWAEHIWHARRSKAGAVF
jgi:DNA repair protein RadD